MEMLLAPRHLEQSSRTLGSCLRFIRMQESNPLRGPPTQGQVPKEPSAALAIKLLLRFKVHVQGWSGEALQESPPHPQNVPHSPRAPRLTHDLWLTR